MVMKACSVVGLLMFPALVYGQKFSVESIVNDAYINSGPASRFYYSHEFSEEYHKDWASSELKFVPIPDSIAEGIFQIKKGDCVTQILDGKITGTDTISGFEVAIIEGAGQVFYFTLENLEARHEGWYDKRDSLYPEQLKYFFYIIGKDKVDLPPTRNVRDDTLVDSLTSSSLEYLVKDSNSEKTKGVIHPECRSAKNVSEVDSLRTLLQRCCLTTITEVGFDGDSLPDFILEIHPVDRRAEHCFRDFSVIFASSLATLHFIRFSHFEFMIEVDDKPYAMFRYGQPDTGIRGRILYSFNKHDKKADRVFAESVMSD